MSTIPPSLDELMWLIAEQDDPSALDAFGKRYPEYRGELAERLKMVHSLKGSKLAGTIDPSFIPEFKPRAYTRPLFPRWPAFAAASVLLVAVAFGSYVAVKKFAAPVPTTGPTAPIETVQPWVANEPGVQTKPLVKPNPEPPIPSGAVAAPEIPPYERPLDLRMEGVTLLEVVSTIVRLSGLSVEVAPGLQNDLVTMDYHGMTGQQMLTDLGKNLGFTPLEEGPGRLLLVPATDPSVHEAPRSAPESASGKDPVPLDGR